MEKQIDKKLLTVKDAAKYLSIGQTTMRKLLAEPNCPYVCKFGGRVFINKTILDKYIDSLTKR